MSFFHWLTGRWSSRHRAMLLYRKGMLKAKLHDHEAAVANYTAVVKMAGAPADVRAMALYNRSLVHCARHNASEAVLDLEKLLEMEGAASNVRTEARRKLARVQRSSDHPADRPTNRDS